MKIEVQRSRIVRIHGRKRHKLQILTVKDLIERPDLGLKTELGFIQSAREARAAARRPKQKPPTPQELMRQPPLPPMPISGGRKAKDQVPLDLKEPVLVPQQTPTRRNCRV